MNIPSVLSLPLLSLAVVCLLMLLVWIWATAIRNASIVDVAWSLCFAVIAVLIWWKATGDGFRKTLVCALMILWSLRLTLHLAARVFTHIHEEEGRYQQLRKDWAPHINRAFFFFFQAQALSTIILSVPFFIITQNDNALMTVAEYTGASLWLLAIIGEGIADAQLARFKKDTANKGKVCTAGLWKYSRHPNYFFQLMIWIAVFIFALSSRYGWLAIISPLIIGYLIFKVTGIPKTEEQSLRSKGEAYREYQRTTSAFIPWFKKH